MTDRPRIAVIDDDSVFVELMHDLLASGEGYDVVSSPHGAHGLEFVKQTRPDLIILDLMMGSDQTGWAVLELLRDDPQTTHIPVILCSAAAPALSQRHARIAALGNVEMVAKPFDIEHLLAVIARLLEQHRPMVGEQSVTRPSRVTLAGTAAVQGLAPLS